MPDRVTLVFRIGAAESYEQSCTVHEEQGLIYLTMHPTPLPDQLSASPIDPALGDRCTSLLYKIEKDRLRRAETAFDQWWS